MENIATKMLEFPLAARPQREPAVLEFAERLIGRLLTNGKR
jgi:hypothetical protein